MLTIRRVISERVYLIKKKKKKEKKRKKRGKKGKKRKKKKRGKKRKKRRKKNATKFQTILFTVQLENSKLTEARNKNKKQKTIN